MSLSLAAVLADSAGRRPDHPALVFDGEPFSYRELWAGAKRYASALRGQGVGAGDRVVLLLPNTPEFPMVYFGALALGRWSCRCTRCSSRRRSSTSSPTATPGC
ncbi:AMP-binding protein [Amycolatopsis sp. EV170708-02-1]|nr:AMP-binding protein [Amycolatopsis sp. EV170708-02-1]UMO99870.1 AMP-binding protein [Amycolatopsis sp. EV170708-02-1]